MPSDAAPRPTKPPCETCGVVPKWSTLGGLRCDCSPPLDESDLLAEEYLAHCEGRLYEQLDWDAGEKPDW